MVKTNQTEELRGLACEYQGAEFHARKQAVTEDLFQYRETTEELPDGYRFRFAGPDPWLTRIVEFIALERLCCPFFQFEITVTPHGGPLWLALRGSDEVKAYLLDELGIGLEPERQSAG